MSQNNMPVRSVLIAIVSGLLFSAHGQSNEIAIPPIINLPKDINTRNQLMDSLNGFLAQKEKKNAENSFVLAGDRMETALLLDELKGIENSARHKSTNMRSSMKNWPPPLMTG